MIGKAPSAQKGAATSPKSYRPPFARFVSNIAKLAGERVPTANEIATAYYVPRNSGK
jgi:hypothetical protein